MKRRLKLNAAIIACSFAISFLISTNFPTAYAKIASLFKKVQGDIIEIFHEAPDQKPSRAKTSSPEEELPESNSPGSSSVPEKTRMEDAKNKIVFPLLKPSYIPEGFTLNTVSITKETSGTYNDAYFEYL